MRIFNCIRFRIALLLLCCVFLLPLAVSCTAKEGIPDTSESSGQTEPITQQPEANGLPVESLADYIIIYPSGETSSALFQEMQKLRKTIQDTYGAVLSIRDDFLKEGTAYTVREHEILIGETNRAESAAVYNELKKSKDYEVRLCGKKPVIAGLTDESLIAAVRAFTEVLSSPGELCFFDSEQQVSVKGNYEIQSLTLNQTDLSEFTVVYPTGSQFDLEMAERLTSLIQAKTGDCLKCKPDSAEPVGNELLIGETNRPLPDKVQGALSDGGYYLGISNGNLYLYGSNTPAVYQAVQQFSTVLKDLSGETVNLQLEGETVLCTDTSMTAMSFNVWVKSITPERIERVVTMIKTHMPDTLGVQEANAEWMRALNDALKDDYLYVGVDRDGNGKGEYSAVFYKKDRFTLIESGTKWLSDTPDQVSKINGSICNRVFTYAVLERNNDHKRFMHINTHTDHVQDDNIRLAQVKVITEFLKAYQDLPVLLSGDFNNQEGTAAISHILSAGMENSAKIAVCGSNAPTFKSSVIDFIFLSEGDFRVYEYTVDSEKINGDVPSDHNPILIRYDLIS